MSGLQDGANVVSTLDSKILSQLMKDVAMETPTRCLEPDIIFFNFTSALQRTLAIHGRMVTLLQPCLEAESNFNNEISLVCYTESI